MRAANGQRLFSTFRTVPMTDSASRLLGLNSNAVATILHSCCLLGAPLYISPPLANMPAQPKLCHTTWAVQRDHFYPSITERVYE